MDADTNSIIDDATADFKASWEFFEIETRKLRTGRAYPGLLDQVMVEAYDSLMPINQLATISVPSANSLQVTPFDTNNLSAVLAGLRADKQLDLNPTDNGKDIYITIPPLTVERRQQLVKTLQQKREETYIRLRQTRHKILKTIKEIDNLAVSETKQLIASVDKAMDNVKGDISKLFEQKAQEIASV